MNVEKFQIRNLTGKDDVDLVQIEQNLEPFLCLLENLDICDACQMPSSFTSILSINEDSRRLSINLSEKIIDIEA
ncbi:MAG: hypothetical protein ACFFD4_22330 [Candidatus Odinarchaeota archaeon]